MNQLTWIGQLHDGRVILETEDLPADAPNRGTAIDPSRWKAAWKCEVKGRRHICGAPAGVTCRCKEIFHGVG